MAGRKVTGAKDASDTDAAYLLHLAIHFVDPKTNQEIASVPLRPYYGNDWGFERYLRAALEEVNPKIQVEATGAAPLK